MTSQKHEISPQAKPTPDTEPPGSRTRYVVTAPSGLAWSQDLVVFGSITLTALAAAVLAKTHAGLTITEALPVGIATCIALGAIHTIYRWQRKAAVLAPNAPVKSRRVPQDQSRNTVSLSNDVPSKVSATAPPPPMPPLVAPSWAMPPAVSAEERYTGPSTDHQSSSRLVRGMDTQAQAPRSDAAYDAPDTETLQQLIADLARTVPGPKASTPDPDRVAVTPQIAPNAQMEPSLDATLASEARALRSVAETMATPLASTKPSFADTIDEALGADRVATYLEPIQALDERRARHFEVSIRLRTPDGTELAPDEVEATALRAGLTPRLDAAKLPRAARIATHLAERGRGYDILSTIAALSITDPSFQDVLAEVFYDHDTPHVVLSFTQDDVRDFAPIHWQALHAISAYGVRFAVESVFDLDIDFEALKTCGFDFVKLDAEVLLAGLPSPSGLIPADHICRYLSTLGFSIVVAGLDDEDTLARVMGFGVMMGQGTLFGGRRQVKAEVLSTREAA